MQWNLIRLRKESGKTQGDLAEMLGISTGAYRNKESGENQFKSDEMFALAEYFGKKLDEVFLPIKYTKSKRG